MKRRVVVAKCGKKGVVVSFDSRFATGRIARDKAEGGRTTTSIIKKSDNNNKGRAKKKNSIVSGGVTKKEGR